MKPAFALSFSENGISLHHQSDGDWYCIGTVPLDAPDFADQMQALRDQGFALENDLSCKLVIPPDQVRLLTIDTDGMDLDAVEQTVRTTLDSATPYDLSELTYVAVPDGPNTHVAAIAKRTMDEAHSFAIEHGFIPEAFWVSATGDDALNGPVHELPTSEPDTIPVMDTPAPMTEAPKEAPDESPDVPVHAIAEAADPAAFRPVQSAAPSTVSAEVDVKRYVIPAVAASVLLGMVVGLWSLNRDAPTIETPEPQVTEAPEPEPQPEVATTIEPNAPKIADTTAVTPSDDEPELSATDAAILEALKVAPEPVEEIADLPDSKTAFREFTGTAPIEPNGLTEPPKQQDTDIYLTSVDRADLSTDTIALPSVDSLNTDEPFETTALPGAAGQRFELDERGLVTPSAEGTLNPAGVMVYLGRPSSVPPEPPTRFETEPVVEQIDDRLAGRRPRPRPDNLVDLFERQQLGGRSREELASVRPKLRPESLQTKPQVDETPTALAVVRVPRPKARPANIAALVAKKPDAGSAPLGSTANVATKADEAGSFQPKAVKPKIPTTASVARQATIDNAINLRKLNLIGVYGTPANRRALVRLPSGRYKKLKVGDRIDGGNVIAIGDSELRYQKRGKNITLKMPRG
ncbi:hypothetical protein SAMN05444358_1011069 [Ruegeria halocynthiae]|uniref:Type IV pilus biogenesis protein PilP n=1 Tax=Ruegeria halocynthiae TaxID=985054 RepID=A0A1H2UB34_9RHOB|nr:hypothetical protein [Ruegeria halocynthiae]SDW52674.1 hypothetical protein SAMN05444358_1011069 [Ruegeria halocynthiae]